MKVTKHSVTECGAPTFVGLPMLRTVEFQFCAPRFVCLPVLLTSALLSDALPCGVPADDFYMSASGLVVLETTDHIFDPKGAWPWGMAHYRAPCCWASQDSP